jgi:hypothetical protein
LLFHVFLLSFLFAVRATLTASLKTQFHYFLHLWPGPRYAGALLAENRFSHFIAKAGIR